MKIFRKISILSVLTVLFFSGTVFYVLSQSQATVSLVPSSQNVQLGQNVSVAVNIANVSDLYGCQISLSYDPTILSYQGVTEGSFLKSGSVATLTIDPQVSAGSIWFYGISRTGNVAGVNGSGNLATFNFATLKAGASPLTLITNVMDYRGSQLINSSIAAIAYSKTDSSITVASQPLPSPAISLTKTVDKTSAQAGEVLTYAITYRNTGQAEARNIVITDVIPNGTLYVQGSAASGGVFNNNQIVWTINSLQPSAQGAVSFQVRVE